MGEQLYSHLRDFVEHCKGQNFYQLMASWEAVDTLLGQNKKKLLETTRRERTSQGLISRPTNLCADTPHCL